MEPSEVDLKKELEEIKGRAAHAGVANMDEAMSQFVERTLRAKDAPSEDDWKSTSCS